MAQHGGRRYEARLTSGRARLWEWRLAEAEAAFAAALRLCPDAADAQYLLGEAPFLQCRLDEALRCRAAAARLVNGAGTEPEFPGELTSGLVPGDFGWMSHMLEGDFAAAWRCADEDREQRLRAGISVAGWPRHMRPVRDGRPLVPSRARRHGPVHPLRAAAGARGGSRFNLHRGPEFRRWRVAPDGALPMAEIFAGDAAATIAGLDLVVTVDPMVAHLTGALGVPVWLMLHFAADWRWLLRRDDSPWYPTMRLFRQPSPGDWESVVAAVAAALRDRARR
jgi:hypothetical protein